MTFDPTFIPQLKHEAILISQKAFQSETSSVNLLDGI